MLSVQHEPVWGIYIDNIATFVEEVVAKYAHNEQFRVDNSQRDAIMTLWKQLLSLRIQ